MAHSSGNHGFAVAHAARLLGISPAIVVPENAPAVKTAAIESAGADLVRVSPTFAARVAATEEIARVRGYHLVAPFDDRGGYGGSIWYHPGGFVWLHLKDRLALRIGPTWPSSPPNCGRRSPQVKVVRPRFAAGAPP